MTATPETTDVVRMAGLIRMLAGQREFDRGERRRGWDQQIIQDELDWFRDYWSNAGIRESMPCVECGGKMDDDGDGKKCHLCCEYPNSRGEPGSDSNAASASKCKFCDEREPDVPGPPSPPPYVCPKHRHLLEKTEWA